MTGEEGTEFPPNTEVNRRIGKWLAQLRRELGWTQENASTKARISGGAAALGRYENGRRQVAAGTFLRLVSAYAKAHDKHWTDLIGQLPLSPANVETTTSSMYPRAFSAIERAIGQLLDKPKAMISEISEAVANTVNAGVVAAFEYRWEAGVLERVSEMAGNPDIKTRLESGDYRLQEEYYPADEIYITERAWRRQDDMFVADYGTIYRTAQRRVNRDSYERHERLLSAVLSTMYGKIGDPDQRFLLRCFNRSDHPSLLLDKTQFMLLQELCEFSTKILTRKIAERRLDEQQRIATLIKQRNPTSKVLSEIRVSLANEGLSRLLFLHRRERGNPFKPVSSPEIALEDAVADYVRSDEYVREVSLHRGALVETIANDETANAADTTRHIISFPISARQPKKEGAESPINVVVAYLISRGSCRRQPHLLTRDALESAVPMRLDMMATYASLAGLAIP